MEIGSTSLLGFGSRCCSRVLILPLVLLCCPLVCCCLVATALFPGPSRYNLPPLPGTDDFPPVQTVPAVPALPSRTPDSGPLLDPQGIPLFGSAALESGFSPDPYLVQVQAGGSVDTAGLPAPCGFTPYHPAFVLDWQAGDTEPFLHLSFTPDEDTGTTLLVHTPEDEWLCEQGSSGGTVTRLDILIPSAPAGEYAIWAGTREQRTVVEGSLSITGRR